MATKKGTRQLPPVAVIFLCVVLLGLLLLAAVALMTGLRSAAYPGATMVSQHSRATFAGHPSLRLDSSYRTTDPFPAIYNWYSVGFDLGTESHAQGGCILLGNTHSMLLLRHHMSAMICDTTDDRMIFVERTISLPLP
jgi:hypothetical protein